MSMNVRTDDRSTYQFFPVTCSQISLRIKASEDAHVILTSQPYEGPPCYEIFFGGTRNTRTIIRKNQQEPNAVEASTPGILSQFEYRSFWIRWDSGVVAAGVLGDSMPTVSYHDPNLFLVHYYGLRSSWGVTGEWLIDPQQPLPTNFTYPGSQPPVNPYYPQPSTLPPPPLPLASGPKWASGVDGSIPAGAIVGGHDVSGEALYVGRAFHLGAVIPGKCVASHKVTYIAWGGQEIAKNVYEILCDCAPRWITTSGDGLPYGALICGRAENGESLYVGRAYHEGSLVPGKVQLSHGVCYIPFAGAEVAKSQYEILSV